MTPNPTRTAVPSPSRKSFTLLKVLALVGLAALAVTALLRFFV